MGDNLEAPARSSDAFVPEAPPSQERDLVKYPTNAKDGADWNSKVTSMRGGGESAVEDAMLKGFALTGTDSSTHATDVDGDGIADDPGGPTSSELKQQENSREDLDGDGVPDNPSGPTSSELKKEASQDLDGDGIADDPSGPTSSELKQLESSVDSHGKAIPDDPNLPAGAVLEQLAKLQQDQERLEDPLNASSGSGQGQTLAELSHAGEDSTEDTGSTAILPNNLSLEYHGAVKQVSDKRKKIAEAESGDGRFSATDVGSDAHFNSENLAARSLGSDAPPVASLPQGIDKISIFDITTRKEEDGSVVLVAPRGHGSNSDRVPLVDNDGSNIKAARLGQFLQSDGTMFMGEDGRAYRPGDNFAAASRQNNNGDNGNFAVDSHSVEKSLVLDKTELNNLSTNLASEKLIVGQRFTALRESKLEERSLERVASTTNDSTRSNSAELSFEPKEAAEQQRSIKVRLGETLRSVAVRDLNDVKNWQVLAEKNNLSTATDDRGIPIASLERGMVLTLPTASEIENFQARASLAAALLTV